MPTTRDNQKKIDKHVLAFKKAGGKITMIKRGVTGITGPPSMGGQITKEANKKGGTKKWRKIQKG